MNLACALIFAGLCVGQPSSQYTIACTSTNPHVLRVNSGYDTVDDLLLMDGDTVSLYENFTSGGIIRLQLPERTSAVDFADVDGDGRKELLLLSGRRVMRLTLTLETPEEPRVLFETTSIFESHTGVPFPHIMAVERQGITLLAIPTAEELLAFTVEGEIVERFPIGANAPRHAAIGQPFQSLPLLQNRAAPESALEFMVNQTLALKPDLPSDWLPTSLPIARQRRGTLRQLQEVATQIPTQWPWFQLSQAHAPGAKVFYAVDTGTDFHTLLALQNTSDETRISPVKRFPGHIIQPESMPPDFNKDGYHDFVTWYAPAPTPNVGVLGKVLGGGTWPFSLRAHFYEPDGTAFSTRANMQIIIDIDMQTLLETGPQLPLHHVLMEDMNGDGHSDIAFSLGAHFMVWFHSVRGFSKNPDIVYEAGTAIEGMPFNGYISEAGAHAVLLSTETTLHVLSGFAAKP